MSKHGTQAPSIRRTLGPVIILGIILAAGLFYVVRSNSTLGHLMELKERKTELLNECTASIQRIHAMQREIAKLKSDPDLQEYLVRTDLGYIRPGETVYWIRPIPTSR